jgi:hypothetical protein
LQDRLLESSSGTNMGIASTPAKRTPMIPLIAAGDGERTSSREPSGDCAYGRAAPNTPAFWPARRSNGLDSPCVIVEFTKPHVRLD